MAMMNRQLFHTGIALLFLGLVCLGQSRAQLTLTGVGGGFGGSAFVGPGNVIASAKVWGGLRAYTLAAAGNKAVRLVRASDSTQQDINTLSPSGALDVASASTFCNATTCKVVTLYDQTGALNCGGAACDLTQATDASRPAFTFNCIGSLPCMTFAGAQTLNSALATGAVAQPYTVSTVAERTGNTAAFNDIFSQSGAAFQDGFSSTANNGFIFAGTVVSVTGIADSSIHALQFVHSGASSILYADGVSSGAVSAGTNSVAGQVLSLGSTAGSNFLTGIVTEAGLWGVDFSSGVSCASQSACLSAMNSNQHSYWGF